MAANGLTLHVGISCGELCFAILGGIDNYWECLMSGEPIGLVADALDEAKKQEVRRQHYGYDASHSDWACLSLRQYCVDC